ncbi:hypothetical protein LTR36_001439 [Oleoguttula mirabilis]|uniref:Selenoprotein W n=1 Tax=Oleoguttula mirabilis TaxID=1507867 RepID=A0AAV9JQE6_9PEZI|nr:hypothetical protein LTR36_001439 [Oleoguttula mirabilis]
MEQQEATSTVVLPRVAITYCTQCKWLLRAAYFGQELLSTFGTSIGEIALIPATGGIFTVYLTHKPDTASEAQQVLLWDRKAEGGFPETKILKQRVRNHIEPEKKLGHSDTPSSKDKAIPTGNGNDGGHGEQTGEAIAPATTGLADAENDPLVQEAAAQECQDCQ